MKKHLLILTAGALALPVAAWAAKKDTPKTTKPELVQKYDANKNGKLDTDELEQIKSDFLADPRGDLKRLDSDHDGKLSDAELALLAGAKKAQREDGKKPGAKRKKDL